jgi:hypothetical protein
MITYRTGGAWGGGSGSDLSPAQVDANFWTLQLQINSITIPTPVGISGFSVTGAAFTVTLTNATVLGPYTLPTSQWNWRGAWAATTAYSVNDTFGANGSVYLVAYAHVSAATFAAGANDGAGHDYYDCIFTTSGSVLPTGGAANQLLAKSSSADFALQWVNAPLAANGVPTGGATGQILAKTSSADYDIEWIAVPSGLPAGGATGYVLTKNSSADYDVGWSVPSAGGGGGGSFVPTITGPQTNDGLRYDAYYGWINAPLGLHYKYYSGSGVTLDASYAGCLIEVDATTTAAVFTIPANATTALEVDTEMVFQQTGGGNPVSFAAASGVTLVYDQTCLPQTAGDFSRAMLKQVQTNRWFLYGDLAPALGNLGATSGTVPINEVFGQVNCNDVYEVTPTGDMTINASSQIAGRKTFIVLASGTTSYNLTFGTGFKSQGPLATGAVTGKAFTVEFVSDGTTYYEVGRIGPL